MTRLQGLRITRLEQEHYHRKAAEKLPGVQFKDSSEDDDAGDPGAHDARSIGWPRSNRLVIPCI